MSASCRGCSLSGRFSGGQLTYRQCRWAVRLVDVKLGVVRTAIHICAVIFLAIGPAIGWPGVAAAVEPPVIDPAALPADGMTPEVQMQQQKGPMIAFAREGSQFVDPPWSAEALRLAEAHKWSEGATAEGEPVLVAVIDTGVNASARVPAEPGGDLVIEGGDGLQDLDSHGTLVASLIAGRPGPDDRFVSVAPKARVVSIRHTSKIFTPRRAEPPDPNDPNQSVPAGSVRTLARAIKRAAELGAKVISIAEQACLKAADGIDQASLGAAVRYAVVEKDAVIVAAAGNTSEDGLGGNCGQNPPPLPSNPTPLGMLGWDQVSTVVTPAWYAPLVLAVGATDRAGAPVEYSIAGPWVGVTAPGGSQADPKVPDDLGLTALFGDHPVNALPGQQNVPTNIAGTSFATAQVAGVAALVRAKYPKLTANQVMDRIIRTARHPGTGWDNKQGFGAVDPVAALTWDVLPLGPEKPMYTVKAIALPPVQKRADHGPVNWVVGAVLVVVAAGGAFLLFRAAASK